MGFLFTAESLSFPQVLGISEAVSDEVKTVMMTSGNFTGVTDEDMGLGNGVLKWNSFRRISDF